MVKEQLRAAWQRFLHDERGAVCVGGCFEVVDGVLQLQLDPAGGLTCGGAGLAATAVPTTAVPISNDGCNGLKRHGDGLYVVCPDTVVGQHDDAPVAYNDSVSGPNNLYNYESVTTATVTNTLCHPVSGQVTIREGGLYMQDLAAGFLTIAHIEVSVNGGGYVAATPFASRRYLNNDAANVADIDFDNMVWSDTITNLAAGASITYKPRVQVNIQGASAGAGHIIGSIGFRTQWHLTPSGGC